MCETEGVSGMESQPSTQSRMNPYKVLKVPKTAGAKEVRESFRLLSKKLHPDAGGTDEAFIELRTAYTVLSDPEKRKKYDETGLIDVGAVKTDLSCMAGLMIELFNAVLSSGEALKEDVDLIKLMKASGVLATKEIKEKIENIQCNLKSLRRLRERISTADNKHNLFLCQLDEKIAKAARLEVKLTTTSRALSLLDEELSNYTCMVEVVQAANLFTNWTVTTTS